MFLNRIDLLQQKILLYKQFVNAPTNTLLNSLDQPLNIEIYTVREFLQGEISDFSTALITGMLNYNLIDCEFCKVLYEFDHEKYEQIFLEALQKTAANFDFKKIIDTALCFNFIPPSIVCFERALLYVNDGEKQHILRKILEQICSSESFLTFSDELKLRVKRLMTLLPSDKPTERVSESSQPLPENKQEEKAYSSKTELVNEPEARTSYSLVPLHNDGLKKSESSGVKPISIDCLYQCRGLKVIISNAGNGLYLSWHDRSGNFKSPYPLTMDSRPKTFEIYAVDETRYQIFNSAQKVLCRIPPDSRDQWVPTFCGFQDDLQAAKWRISLYNPKNPSKDFLIKAGVYDYYLGSNSASDIVLTQNINDYRYFKWNFQPAN